MFFSRHKTIAALVFCVCFASHAFAQTIITHLEVDSTQVTVGVPFTVTIFVDHPYPSEVALNYAPLEPHFRLSEARTSARFVKHEMFKYTPGYKGDRWTTIEMVILPRDAGDFVLGPFRINIGTTETLLTGTLFMHVAPARGEKVIFYWEESVNPASRERETILTLRAKSRAENTLDRANALAIASALRYPPQRDVILEEIPVSARERASGVVYRLRAIPLRSSVEIRLEGQNIVIEDSSADIPPVTVIIR